MEFIRTNRIISFEIENNEIEIVQTLFLLSTIEQHNKNCFQINKKIPFNSFFVKDGSNYIKSCCIFKYEENGNIVVFKKYYEFNINPLFIIKELRKDFIGIEKLIYSKEEYIEYINKKN